MPEEFEKKIKPESKEEKKLKITIIDDDIYLMGSMKRLFPEDKYDVSGLDNPVSSVEEAMDLIKKTAPDAVVLDMNLTDKYEREGLEVAKIIKEEYPEIEIIINSTDWGSPELEKTWKELGIARGVSKVQLAELPKILDEWEKEKAEPEKETDT